MFFEVGRTNIGKEYEYLEESIKLFRLLVDQSNDAIEVIDPQNGQFLYVNNTGSIELGYSKEEFLKLCVFDIDPTTSPSIFSEVVKKLHKKNSLIWEGVHIRKNGTSFPVEVSLKLINVDKEYLVSVARNISFRKQAEDSLSTLSKAVEQSPASILITDYDGIIEYVNPKVIESSGYNVNEVMGKNIKIFNTFTNNDDKTKILWDTIKSGNAWSGELQYSKNGGVPYWEAVSVSPVKNKKGKITHFVAIKDDITEKKKSEIELKKHRDHLEELVAERTEELEEKNNVLEHYIKLFEGRELRIKELRDKVKDLENKLGGLNS